MVGGGAREACLARVFDAWGHGVHRVAAFTNAAVREAAHGCDLVVVGPEAPLVAGLVDDLTRGGLACLGPTRAAARLEGSKAFARAFCARHGIPMARGTVVRSVAEAEAWCVGPVVVKRDGLAGGKGTRVCDSREEMRDAVREALADGGDVIVEERLYGVELTVMALCDGARVVPLPPARDYKRRFDGDRGPNTGSMGAVAPVAVDTGILAACHAVLRSAVEGMAAEGARFHGVLYGGFMLTEDGPRLLEFNARFGDPECAAVLALLDEDLAPWLLAAARGCLPEGAPRLRTGAACSVVAAAAGYPHGACDTPLLGLPTPAADLHVDLAGVCDAPQGRRARGGRIVTVTGVGPTLAAARLRAYHAVRGVRFDGVDWRTDIGADA